MKFSQLHNYTTVDPDPDPRTIDPDPDPRTIDPEAQKAFNKGGAAGLVGHAQKKIDEWKTTTVNIAVTGQRGSGKSSFINTIRDIDDYNHEGYAKTDIEECTMEPSSYDFPENDNIKMWDLPGAGTATFRASEYADKMEFPKYDAFVILSCDGFTEIDKMIADEAKKLGKPIFFARTKMDNALRDQKKKLKHMFDKATELKKVKENIKRELHNNDNVDNIFLVVNLPPTDEDLLEHFPDNDNENLRLEIVESLPAIQKTAMAFSLAADSEKMIDRKSKELSSRIEWLVLVSGVGGAIPVPGVFAALDVSIMVAEAMFQKKQLGINEDSLKKKAASVGSDKENIMKYVNKEIKEDKNSELFGRLIGQLVGVMSESVENQAFKFGAVIAAQIGMIELVESAVKFTIPIVGMVLGAVLSAGSCYRTLSQILKAHTTIAKKCLTIFSKKAMEMKK